MSAKKSFRTAIVGATGMVGQELISILKERQFPMDDLTLFASQSDSEKNLKILSQGCFQGKDLVFFDATDAISKIWVQEALDAGAWVIDHSAAFRMDPDVVLMVPEVNQNQFQPTVQKRKLIAGPNCVVVPLSMVLKPLRDVWGLKRVIVSTYQSVSGAGRSGMKVLQQESQEFLQEGSVHSPSGVFPSSIAFNCVPQIGEFVEGWTGEEKKIVSELRKILELPALPIAATAVRVPTFSCHAQSVYVECCEDRRGIPWTVHEISSVLAKMPGVTVCFDQASYPTGGTGRGIDEVRVGRVRLDETIAYGLLFWVVSDNVRKGAALNAVQIAETLLRV